MLCSVELRKKIISKRLVRLELVLQWRVSATLLLRAPAFLNSTLHHPTLKYSNKTPALWNATPANVPRTDCCGRVRRPWGKSTAVMHHSTYG
jgi:hypothetical protein